jgi:hypothetical protein
VAAFEKPLIHAPCITWMPALPVSWIVTLPGRTGLDNILLHDADVRGSVIGKLTTTKFETQGLYR